VSEVQGFQCPSCKERKNNEEGDRELVTTGGNVLDCEAGVERALRSRVAAAWKKLREMASLITNKSIPLKL